NNTLIVKIYFFIICDLFNLSPALPNVGEGAKSVFF
ncbi:MAG: hypothetical protein ACI8WW_000320, partial [Oceanospirillaceae bacterium]